MLGPLAARREFLKLAGHAAAGGIASAIAVPRSHAEAGPPAQGFNGRAAFDVRAFGATGNGATNDAPAVNKAIEAAAAAGGGVVRFRPGTYACFSIRLKSFITLFLDPGAVILAAATPHEGTESGGYDAAESNAPWEGFQDFGHNHWHNSLIWGEGVHDVAILGTGLIWGNGLSRGRPDIVLPSAEKHGIGNKAIAFKNCHNVTLRDFSILAGGHFGILATGVDNLTIDNLKIDTNRDGMNIDCCKNVRISNCSVNSPWDDGICLKSTFALGYPRATEDVTISGCYLTGGYRLGTLLNGTFERFRPGVDANIPDPTGRIKFGTESNGGFRNITVSSCVFESCRGLALESVDGGALEDITIDGVTMHDVRDAPLFLRLGVRLRGPNGTVPGTLKRVILSNIVCYGPASQLPSIISGVPGQYIEDIKLSDIYVAQKGGGTPEMAALQPAERESDYPEPIMFGPLPAQGFFIRHAKNIEFSNIEVANAAADARPVFWLHDVDGADFSGIRLPRKQGASAFLLNSVQDFRVSGSPDVNSVFLEDVARQQI